MGSFCGVYTMPAAQALHNTMTSTVREATDLEAPLEGEGNREGEGVPRLRCL